MSRSVIYVETFSTLTIITFVTKSFSFTFPVKEITKKGFSKTRFIFEVTGIG